MPRLFVAVRYEDTIRAIFDTNLKMRGSPVLWHRVGQAGVGVGGGIWLIVVCAVCQHHSLGSASFVSIHLQ